MRRAALLIGLGVLVLAIVPRRHLVGPDWDIYLVDQDGKPMPGVRMRVYESNPTVEENAPDIERTTDAQGHVFLPKRVVRVSTLRSAYGTLKQIPFFVHAEFNAYGYASIECPPGYGHANVNEPGSQGAVWYRGPERTASRVVLYRCVSGVQRLGCDDKAK